MLDESWRPVDFLVEHNSDLIKSWCVRHVENMLGYVRDYLKAQRRLINI